MLTQWPLVPSELQMETTPVWRGIPGNAPEEAPGGAPALSPGISPGVFYMGTDCGGVFQGHLSPSVLTASTPTPPSSCSSPSQSRLDFQFGSSSPSALPPQLPRHLLCQHLHSVAVPPHSPIPHLYCIVAPACASTLHSSPSCPPCSVPQGASPLPFEFSLNHSLQALPSYTPFLLASLSPPSPHSTFMSLSTTTHEPPSSPSTLPSAIHPIHAPPYATSFATLTLPSERLHFLPTLPPMHGPPLPLSASCTPLSAFRPPIPQPLITMPSYPTCSCCCGTLPSVLHPIPSSRPTFPAKIHPIHAPCTIFPPFLPSVPQPSTTASSCAACTATRLPPSSHRASTIYPLHAPPYPPSPHYPCASHLSALHHSAFISGLHCHPCAALLSSDPPLWLTSLSSPDCHSRHATGCHSGSCSTHSSGSTRSSTSSRSSGSEDLFFRRGDAVEEWHGMDLTCHPMVSRTHHDRSTMPYASGAAAMPWHGDLILSTS
ncbi:unnamed protein product [Closterium sp. NIES-54]